MARDSENISAAITAANKIISDQAAALKKVKSVLASKTDAGTGGIAYGKPWVRPSNFPNYDFVDRTNEESVYLSYDCTMAKAFPDIPQYASIAVGFSDDTTQATVERGYIDSSGFHAESTQDYVVTDYHIEIALPTDGRDYIVFRIAPKSGAHISEFGLYPTYAIMTQPCVEIWGRLPNLSGSNLLSLQTTWLESCDITGMSPTAFQNTFYTDTRLRNVAISVGTLEQSDYSLYGTFQECASLVSLDLSGWDVSAVTGMTSVFDGCLSLVSLNISGWDTSNVTNTGSMFSKCNSLLALDLSGWDTSKLEDTTEMFAQCWSLRTLNLSGWDTSKLKYALNMFNMCNALTDLNLSGWNTSALLYIDSMFSGCTSLTSLDLSGWNTSAIHSAYDVFNNCTSLKSLNLSGWELSSVDNSMIANCESLVDFYPGTFHESYSLKSSDKLSDESIARIITALPTVTTSQTLTLHATVKAKLTDEQISTANTKGWTIA